MTDERHTFHACGLCGATVRDDYLELHEGWHEELTAEDSVPPVLELEPWPAATAPAAGPLDRL